ncbi:MAG TPA: SCO family protein [Longimicrobiales bacterium]
MRYGRLLSATLLSLLLAGCADDDAHHDEAHEHTAAEHAEHAGHEDDVHDHAHDAVPAGEITSGSVYNLDGQWWDATGARAPLGRLAGRPQVVAMVYTSCAQACPAIVSDMKRIEAALGPDADGVGFVLASMDPERDTPEKLAEFARRSGFDAARWTLLGAADDDVLELAAVLGVQYRGLPDGEFTHSNILTVLDANGEIVHRQLGLGESTAETAAAARRHIIDRNRT